jgi:CHAT domain-containing protein
VPPAEALAAAVQARLAGSGAALVEVVVLPAETVVFSVDESGVTAVREAVAREKVAALTERAAAGDRAAAAALYELLLRRAAALPRARALIVVADPLLEALPFAALYDARAKQYLIERLPVMFAESAASLRPAAPRPSPARVLAMALPSGESAGSVALAETGAEVGDVASSYRAARMMPAAQATFPALKAAGRDAEVIHLSGHTEETGGGGTSALLFAGEDGAARQRVPWKSIAGASFPRLQVAVLAACNTLRLPPRGVGARAPSLAGAFLAAGAHTAVGTLRPVGDRDARTLFRALHQHLGAGLPAAAAVRNAQLEAIAEGTPPGVWSAVAVIGRDVPRNL